MASAEKILVVYETVLFTSWLGENSDLIIARKLVTRIPSYHFCGHAPNTKMEYSCTVVYAPY